MSVILLVSHQQDSHLEAVLPYLATTRPLQIFFLQLDLFPKEYSYWHSYNEQGLIGELVHHPSGQRVALEAIKVVWLRKGAPFQFAEPLAPQELAFARGEADQTILGLLYSLPCYFFNHPWQVRGAIWKVEQLQRAQQHGFLIPPTLTCNNGAQLRQFASQAPHGLIYKTLSSPTLAAEDVDPAEVSQSALPTTLLELADLQDDSMLALIPGHFQYYVPKAFELRVIVIGEHVFAARIDSQSDERTQIDCRDMTAVIEYSAYPLSDSQQQQIRRFVQSYGLQYSALDFIVQPDLSLVFLENNPCGQFLYIEELVPTAGLAAQIARTLLEAADAN